MRDRLTTSELAEDLGISPRRVIQIACSRRNGKGVQLIELLSEKRNGRREWVPSSISRLRPGPVGRPIGAGITMDDLKKARARRILLSAVRSGRLVRLPCEMCGEKKSEAHHEDYAKPLEVRWLCSAHHREAHGHGPVGRPSGSGK